MIDLKDYLVSPNKLHFTTQAIVEDELMKKFEQSLRKTTDFISFTTVYQTTVTDIVDTRQSISFAQMHWKHIISIEVFSEILPTWIGMGLYNVIKSPTRDEGTGVCTAFPSKLQTTYLRYALKTIVNVPPFPYIDSRTSVMVRSVLGGYDVWFASHLTTHRMHMI